MKSNLRLGVAVVTMVLVGGVAWIIFHHLSFGATPPSGSVTESEATIYLSSPPTWNEQTLLELSASDPVEAIRLSSRLANGAERERILVAALETLTRTHPAIAAEIVAGLPAGDFQQVAAGKVAQAFAKVDPASAFSWAQALGNDATRLRAVREVAAAWAESDPKSAAVSVASLRDERERQLGALAVATAWTQRDPVESLAWAATLQPLEARALVAGSAVQTWAERDAPAAMEWLANQSVEFHAAIDPDTSLAVIGKWAVQDPAAVREFVTHMTSDAGQARAAGVVAGQLAKLDPVATMQWALTLPRDAVRNGAFSKAYQQWREVAPQTAEAWLHAADLTAEEKRRLVNCP